MTNPPVTPAGAPRPESQYSPLMPIPPGPRLKKRTWPWVAVVLIGAALCCGGVVVAAVTNKGDGKPINVTTGGPAAPAAVSTTRAPQVAVVAPDLNSFTIAVNVIKSECFDTAGANVTFRIDPSYNGPAYTQSKTWEVVYQVNGGEAPLINHFTMTGGQASFDSEEMIQTKSCKYQLTAAATKVNAP